MEIRVREKDLKTLDFLGIKRSHVWELGMEHIYKNMPKYVQKVYVQMGEITTNVRTINGHVETRNSNLDTLCCEYLQYRDIDNPTPQDINWIEGRVEKIDGLTTEGFITYC